MANDKLAADAMLAADAVQDDNKAKKHGKKPNSKYKKGNYRRRGGDGHYSKPNPFDWYDRFPQVIRDAGNLPFATPVGQQVDFDGWKFRSPGVCVLSFVPTIGVSQDLTSPINRSMARFYTYLRDVQKAAATYDAADVMMYLMALDSLYIYWAYLVRVYQVANLFTPINQYYPQTLLKAMGVDQSIRSNLADFRMYINRFGLQLASYAMPKDFDITSRHMWMTSGLYVDSQTTRAQTYLFVPRLIYQYNNTVTTGSKLTGIALATPDFSRDLGALTQLGDSLINSVILDQDTGNISGDLYRAYGLGGLRSVPEVREMDAILPIYNQSVLDQIHNATIIGQFNGLTEITQDPSVNGGAIRQFAEFTQHWNIGGQGGAPAQWLFPQFPGNNAMIDLRYDSPTAEQVIEATRLTVLAPTSGTKAVAPYCLPADVIRSLYLFVNPYPPSGVPQWIEIEMGALDMSDTTSVADNLARINALAKFDWAPRIYLYSKSTVSSGPMYYCEGFTGDVDNFSAITRQQLFNMHEASLYSLFNVPQFGKPQTHTR